MNIYSDTVNNAVATGSELIPSFIKGSFFTPENNQTAYLKKKPALAFDADFFRWILSDCPWAAYVSAKKIIKDSAIKLSGLNIVPHDGEPPTYMYSGGMKNDDDSVSGCWQYFFVVVQQLKIIFLQSDNM